MAECGCGPIPHSALDRLNEAHWQLHQMEQYYHFADPFRWSLNGFLRALKEIPQLLAMELQHQPGFVDWYRQRRAELASDRLLGVLFKARDVIVHQKMLMPNSSGHYGITRGRGIKLGIGGPFDPRENSDDVIMRLANAARVHGDFLGLFDPSDEDTAPCVERTWRIPEFPDDDIVDLGATAWHVVAQGVADSIERVGGARPELRLDCPHGSQRVKQRVYSRSELGAFVYGPGSNAATGPSSPAAMMARLRDKGASATAREDDSAGGKAAPPTDSGASE